MDQFFTATNDFYNIFGYLWTHFKVFNDPYFDIRWGRKNIRNYSFKWFIGFYTITTIVAFKVLSF